MLSTILILNLLVTLCMMAWAWQKTMVTVPMIGWVSADQKPAYLERMHRKNAMLQFPVGSFELMSSFMIVITAALHTSSESQTRFFLLNGIAFFILLATKAVQFVMIKPLWKSLNQTEGSAPLVPLVQWHWVVVGLLTLRTTLMVLSILQK
jgi:hypothetical protein